MFGEIFRFLLEIAFTLFGAALLIRVWMQAITMPRFNPMAHAMHRYTDWLVAPLHRVLPSRGRIDWACLVAAVLTAFVYVILNWLISVGTLIPAAALPVALGAALFMVVRWALNLVIWLTLIQAILSWVNPAAPLMPLLQMLTAPLLNPIRRLLPSSTIDFSPLVVLVLAQVAIMFVTRLGLQIFGF